MLHELVNFLTAMSVIKKAAWMVDGAASAPAPAPSHLGCKLMASLSAVACGANPCTSALSVRKAVLNSSSAPPDRGVKASRAEMLALTPSRLVCEGFR